MEAARSVIAENTDPVRPLHGSHIACPLLGTPPSAKNWASLPTVAAVGVVNSGHLSLPCLTVPPFVWSASALRPI